jgi:hypothetical protein
MPRLAVRSCRRRARRYGNVVELQEVPGAEGQKSLFTEDTHFVVYMDARNPEPTQDLHGREALAPVFDALNA